MAKLIEVQERDLDYIFGQSKPYSLDVYQRDYRWSDDKEYKIVTQLLMDIELRFENNMRFNKRNNENTDLPAILKDVDTNFRAYFLNTIMLNEQEGNIYIVDGQQRLTSVLLLLIKLYHIGVKNKDAVLNVERLIGSKIYEEDMASQKHFKISNEDRNKIIKKIFEKEPILETDINNITQANLSANYNVISKYFDKYFYSADGLFDAMKYNYYVYNLLLKVLIIEQIIKDKQDVAMIFETANDRGKELESHEVLKGMLLGVLDTQSKETCNTIWNESLQTFFQLDGNYSNVDEFFRTYFRAKYADNTTQYKSFGGKYHRNLLSNEKIILDLDRNKPSKIKSFIENEFKYFYRAFLEIAQIAQEDKEIHVASNYANGQGNQTLLVLSALTLNDPDKAQKIALVAKKLDQFYTISRLVGVYDSNNHQRVIHEINHAIRNQSLAGIMAAFDEKTVAHFNNSNIPINSFNEIFHYKHFEKSKIDGRFTKYVLARIDRYIADILNEQSFAKQHSLHFIAHSGAKPVNGFHIEHIFAHNEKIMEQFTDENGDFDEKLFNDERNRLGALILLKGNENIRASNKLYKSKRKSYINSGFLWNKILTNSINQASLNSCDLPIVKEFKGYAPNEKGLLETSVIDERQELLFKLISCIYKSETLVLEEEEKLNL